MIGGRILDTSALVQAARGTPYMQALLYISHEHLIPLVIPAPCLADALAGLNDPQQQARLFDLVRSPIEKVAQFGVTEATGTGLMRASARPARRSPGDAQGWSGTKGGAPPPTSSQIRTRCVGSLMNFRLTKMPIAEMTIG